MNNSTIKMASNVSNSLNSSKSFMSSMPSMPSFNFTTVIISMFVIFILVIVSVFYSNISYGAVSMWDSLMTTLGLGAQPTVNPVTETPAISPEALPDTGQSREFVESILPGRREVFSVNSNKYTYSDAEPLCKALGAELATYEQVKEAWDKGADWCNYGWVKGQVAVYPTQVSTWEKLQNGPEDQRRACGRPGVNGGHFDNPELRFGVNCYGVKPAQSKHDANQIAKREGQPLTPGAIEFDKKVAHYRGEADHIGMLPFNDSSWDQV
jgi:hypothetical protein